MTTYHLAAAAALSTRVRCGQKSCLSLKRNTRSLSKESATGGKPLLLLPG